MNEQFCPYCAGIDTFYIGFDEYQCFNCDMTWVNEVKPSEEAKCPGFYIIKNINTKIY